MPGKKLLRYPRNMRGLQGAVAGALIIGALMTFGDWVWAVLELPHRVVLGLIHGLVLCCGIGLYLGFPRRAATRGALIGGAIGLGAAALFYALAPLLKWSAMLPAWMAFWIAFGVLLWRGMGEPIATLGEAVVRGVVAAFGSGLAFYSIMGIWTSHPPGGPDYLRHFGSWSFAFLPGFVALLAERPRSK
jgi:hypothetical protein